MRRILLISLLCLSTSPNAGHAGPAYTAAQIVDLFSPPAAPEEAETRSVCIGTAQECNSPSGRNEAGRGFNLEVNFELGSNELTAPAKENLEEFARALKDPRLRSRTFLVEGHTDARGSAAYNLALSQRRAEAVVGFLAGKGVERTKLKAKGYGKLRPKTRDPFEGTNRRVEARPSS